MLHDKANAIKHFTTALNLDPKVCSAFLETTNSPYLNQSNIPFPQAAQFIKDAMEALDDDDMEDEDMA
jgi:anaphase-promoting complex subunit 3